MLEILCFIGRNNLFPMLQYYVNYYLDDPKVI